MGPTQHNHQQHHGWTPPNVFSVFPCKGLENSNSVSVPAATSLSSSQDGCEAEWARLRHMGCSSSSFLLEEGMYQKASPCCKARPPLFPRACTDPALDVFLCLQCSYQLGPSKVKLAADDRGFAALTSEPQGVP